MVQTKAQRTNAEHKDSITPLCSVFGVPRGKVTEVHNYFEIPQTVVSVPRNIARIFVRNLEILE
jgi:intein/homing endonuclease